MEKRYAKVQEGMPPTQSVPNYSVPEDEKQATAFSYGEPAEMFVKQHKTLPHLKGRREYQAGAKVEPQPVSQEEPAPIDNAPERAEEAKQPQPKESPSIPL